MLSILYVFFDTKKSDCEKRWYVVVIAQLVRLMTVYVRVKGSNRCRVPYFFRHENFLSTLFRLFENTSCEAEPFDVPV